MAKFLKYRPRISFCLCQLTVIGIQWKSYRYRSVQRFLYWISIMSIIIYGKISAKFMGRVELLHHTLSTMRRPDEKYIDYYCLFGFYCWVSWPTVKEMTYVHESSVAEVVEEFEKINLDIIVEPVGHSLKILNQFLHFSKKGFLTGRTGFFKICLWLLRDSFMTFVSGRCQHI